MSDDQAGTPAPPDGHSGGCLTALLVLLGIVMLLPGLCSLGFMIAFPRDVFGDRGMLLPFLVMLAIGIGGVVLIRYAWRRRSA